MAYVKPGEIRIKNPAVLDAVLEKWCDPKLSGVLLYVGAAHGMVITESYRPKTHANDVHGTDPYRGTDIRSRCYPDPQAVADDINRRYVYDPERPAKKVAVLHDSGQGEHIHLQTHPRTARRDDTA